MEKIIRRLENTNHKKKQKNIKTRKSLKRRTRIKSQNTKKVSNAGLESNPKTLFIKLKFVFNIAGRSHVHLLPRVRGRASQTVYTMPLDVRPLELWSRNTLAISKGIARLRAIAAGNASGGQPNRAPARSTGFVDRGPRHTWNDGSKQIFVYFCCQASQLQPAPARHTTEIIIK